jgi:hypothetical protein
VSLVKHCLRSHPLRQFALLEMAISDKPIFDNTFALTFLANHWRYTFYTTTVCNLTQFQHTVYLYLKTPPIFLYLPARASSFFVLVYQAFISAACSFNMITAFLERYCDEIRLLITLTTNQ